MAWFNIGVVSIADCDCAVRASSDDFEVSAGLVAVFAQSSHGTGGRVAGEAVWNDWWCVWGLDEHQAFRSCVEALCSEHV